MDFALSSYGYGSGYRENIMASSQYPLIDSQKEAIIQLVKTLGYTATDFKFEQKIYFADSLVIADTLLFKNISFFFAQFIWDGQKLDMLIYPSKLGFYHTRAEYLHWTEGFILLKQWLSSLETIIQKAQKNGFQMDAFQLYPIAEKAGIQKIIYQSTEYYFELGGNEKRKKITYRPGETGDIEVIEQPLLSEYEYFAKWLARLKSELNLSQIVTKSIRDLKPLPKVQPETSIGAELQPIPNASPLEKVISLSTDEKSVDSHSRNDGNPRFPKFTPEQLDLIISNIQYLRAQLVKFKIQQIATGKQVEQANQELDYLVATADRVTPCDWSYIACTAINIIASILKLDPTQGKELFKDIQEMLKQIPHHPKHRIIFLPEEKPIEPKLDKSFIPLPPEKSAEANQPTSAKPDAHTFI
jgi:hypothetical protein